MTAPPDTLDLYVVRWPKHGLVKVGVSETERWQKFGDDVEVVFTVRLERALALAVERETHDRMSAECVRPFRRGDQAKRLLGKRGEGFTECYRDDGVALRVVGEVLGEVLAEAAAQPGRPVRCGHCDSCRTDWEGEEPICDTYTEDWVECEACGQTECTAGHSYRAGLMEGYRQGWHAALEPRRRPAGATR